MAKEFKDFEQKYRHLAGTAIKTIESIAGRIAHEDISGISRWNRIIKYETYGHDDIRFAVYNSDSAEEWQQFRVSLKGLSTREKLYCLEWRYVHRSRDLERFEHRLEVIRINNYIGALIRGGQLNGNFEVVR